MFKIVLYLGKLLREFSPVFTSKSEAEGMLDSLKRTTPNADLRITEIPSQRSELTVSDWKR